MSQSTKQRGRLPRRGFLNGLAGGAAAISFPVAARSAGLGASDLAIKEVKLHVVEFTLGDGSKKVEELASIVTNSGIEGNYTLNVRGLYRPHRNPGWLDYAKSVLRGRGALDLPAITSQWAPARRRQPEAWGAAAIDICLWDILGKALALPIYRLLGAYSNRVRTYASSQHLKTPEAFVEDLQSARKQGFSAYKIHPPWLVDNETVDYQLDIQVAKAVRAAAGAHFPLMFDRVCAYSRDEAMKVGHALDEMQYISYEDPLPSNDIEGLAQLAAALQLPVTVGEFIHSPYEYPEYLRRGAIDIVRLIADNVGGITGSMKIAHLAECFGMECQPHNWGNALDHAVHFHCELAMPNCVWFEMTLPQEASDRPYMKDRIRLGPDGYVEAPAKPGLGYSIDYAMLDNLTKNLER